MNTRKLTKIARVLYLLSVFLGVWCTFLALINDKFGERYATFLILYGLVFLPQIALNLLSKILSFRYNYPKVLSLGDVIQPIVAIVVIIFIAPYPNDLEFLIPWAIILVLNLGIAVYYKNK